MATGSDRPRKKMPRTAYPAVDLAEADKVMRALSKVRYPIGSGAELLEQLGGSVEVEGIKVSPHRMLKYVPAHYFPIVSAENFREKIAGLVNENRDQVSILEESESIQAQLPELKYPIANEAALVHALKDKKFRFLNRDVTAEGASKRMPPEMFPIRSKEDFHEKIPRLIYMMATRPLIVPD
jgi:hypothetical protein